MYKESICNNLVDGRESSIHRVKTESRYNITVVISENTSTSLGPFLLIYTSNRVNAKD